MELESFLRGVHGLQRIRGPCPICLTHVKALKLVWVQLQTDAFPSQKPNILRGGRSQPENEPGFRGASLVRETQDPPYLL